MMKKKICLFEQHLNSIRQNVSRPPLEIIKSSLNQSLRATRKNNAEISHNETLTCSWLKKNISNEENSQHFKKITSVFSVPKTSKYAHRPASISKRAFSIQRSLSPTNITMQNKSLSFFNYNQFSPKVSQKNAILQRQLPESNLSPFKMNVTSKKANTKTKALSYEQLINNYITSSTKHMGVQAKSRSKSMERPGAKEVKVDDTNNSIITVNTTKSKNRNRSMPRANRGSKNCCDSRSLQAEINLLFGKKDKMAAPVKCSKGLEDDSKKNRSSLLSKINKAVNKGINVFTKFNLFEEAETEEFDNPKHREYMEDVVYCEFITTKSTPVIAANSNINEKGSALPDKESETEKSLKQSINEVKSSKKGLPIISEKQEIESLADSLIESTMYGNQKQNNKENRRNTIGGNQKVSKENLQVSISETPTNSTNTTKLTLFTIFDGHGGNQVSLKAKELLPKEIHSRINMNTNETTIKTILPDCFERVDKELMTKIPNCDDIGSTCTLCFLTKTKTNRIITVANLGDSHAYIISNKKAVRLTAEHKCNNEEELIRLREKNAIIYQNRMFGQLALTRAFCDRKHKPYGLLATPSVNQQLIKEKPISHNTITDAELEFDLFLVLASDGVWDVTTDTDLMRIFVENELGKSTKQLTRTLIDFAIEKGSTDNISLIVVKL